MGATLITTAAMVILSRGTSASTTSLGGLRSVSLFAMTTTSAKTVSVMADPLTTSGNLGGRVLATGQTWTASTPFKVSNNAISLSGHRGTNALAYLPWWSAGTTIVSDVASSGTFNFGLAMHINSTSGTATVLRFQSDGTAAIVRVTSSTSVTLASATLAHAATWTFTYSNGAYVVRRNGTQVLSYTTTSAERSAWSSSTDVGLYASAPQNSTKWTSFSVQLP